MVDFLIEPGKGLRGEITLPGDKSISHRAIMCASLASGTSEIKGFLDSEDCLATLNEFFSTFFKIRCLIFDFVSLIPYFFLLLSYQPYPLSF